MENSIAFQEDHRIMQLKQILECEQKSEITYAEAMEIGDSLIHFFEILADEAES